MKWRKWLENWDMTSLKIKAAFLEMEWKPQIEDRKAAWDLYVELLTRVATQPLPLSAGDEPTALASIHQLFPITRQIIKDNGQGCIEFTKIAILVLNQIIRPFTSRWHKLFAVGEGISDSRRQEFRTELADPQRQLEKYTKMLADMAGVEDLTEFRAE